jgi:hypothetical protein
VAHFLLQRYFGPCVSKYMGAECVPLPVCLPL